MGQGPTLLQRCLLHDIKILLQIKILVILKQKYAKLKLIVFIFFAGYHNFETPSEAEKSIRTLWDV